MCTETKNLLGHFRNVIKRKNAENVALNSYTDKIIGLAKAYGTAKGREGR